MKLTSFLLQSRGPVNLAKRLPTIVTRFGLTERKIDQCLNGFVDIAQEFDVRPTLAVTANLLDRYPLLFTRLKSRGVEFAIHGLVHTDYSTLSLETHIAHINEAVDIFYRNNIDFSGFRCPYLRSSKHTLEAVRRLAFSWESSDVIAWDIDDTKNLGTNQGYAYKKLLELYSAKDSASNFAVPRMYGRVVEIPVSIPDDEAIVDRLGLNSAAELTRIWLSILDKSYRRGDIFTIQLHHERVPLFKDALRAVLSTARALRPCVFVASLHEIGEWYLKRDKFSLAVNELGEERYNVQLVDNGIGKKPKSGHSDVTVLVKNLEVEDAEKHEWFGGYSLVKANRFTVRCKKRPVIELDPDRSIRKVDLLRSEGFVVEELSPDTKIANPAGKTATPTHDFSLDTGQGFNEVAYINEIDELGVPLVRIWRWPHGCRSALAITGDVDSITITDFARRFFEVRNEQAA
jgi:peptidoglycan/xylan/chitin deacetylase (PgdA/CDA1 family)